MDGPGQIRITSRIKDIINRGGEKFSAADIEWALEAHPNVGEVAVVGYPDEDLGERACASWFRTVIRQAFEICGSSCCPKDLPFRKLRRESRPLRRFLGRRVGRFRSFSYVER